MIGALPPTKPPLERYEYEITELSEIWRLKIFSDDTNTPAFVTVLVDGKPFHSGAFRFMTSIPLLANITDRIRISILTRTLRGRLRVQVDGYDSNDRLVVLGWNGHNRYCEYAMATES